jgi:arylsulfatase A-like enzyme
MAALEEAGVAENTLVIFTSDNGGHWRVTQHAPLRGHKGTYWEGGIRVPLILTMPGLMDRGRVITEPVMATDLYPTILAAAGLPLRPNQHEDGLNLLPLLRGETTLNRQGLFWHFPHYNNHPETRPSSAYRRGDWKLIESFDPAGFELYNLVEDLGETTNRWSTETTRGRAMLEELEQWRRAVGAEPMRPNPDFDPAFQGRASTRRKAN